MKNIAVFCGSSRGFKPVYANAAEELGILFAKNGIGLVYGGGKVGLMGVLADAVLQHNGRVTGVIPGLLRHEEVAHRAITKMHVTKKMSKRKVKISKLADAYIALPGGFGTLDEIFEALTLNQLGIEAKPVGLLNVNHFFDPLLDQLDVMVKEGFLKARNREMLLVGETVQSLFKKIQAYEPPEKEDVINKVVTK